MHKLVYISERTGLIMNRIFDNQHLLDATEIFRKLNVHKKVFDSMRISDSKH